MKQKIWSLKDVNSIWQTDGLIGGLSMNIENHGEIAFTIPTNGDNVYTVFDQLLKMIREDERSDGGDGGDGGVGGVGGVCGGNGVGVGNGGSGGSEQTAQWF